VIRRYLLAVMAAAALGALLAAVAPPAALASIEIVVDIYPGPQSSTAATLNCGWHSACNSPYPDGNGLDWKNAGGDDVFWRSRTYRDDTSTPSAVAWADIQNVTGATCKTVRVKLTDNFGVVRGQEDYVHSDFSSGYSDFWVLGRSWPGHWQDPQIADSASTENTDCVNLNLFHGAHLHQGGNLTRWYSNYSPGTLVHIWDGHHGVENRGDITGLGDRMHQAGWTQ
jgi:hypothetical protein